MTDFKEFSDKKIFVLTPGLPGWGLMDYSYWDTLTFDDHWTKELDVKFILVEPGPMSSHHDRACEIFAQLSGRLTDFGKEHSEHFSHHRHGRDFSHKKLIQEHWSERNPVNFICHCVGINTVRYLQYLLAEDFWKLGTNEKWIKSIVSINGNINGTQFLHFLGIDSVTGLGSKKKLCKATKKVFNGVLWSLNRLKNLTEFQKQIAVEWNWNHWNVSTKTDNWQNQMLTESAIFTNSDNLFYDSTIHGANRLNSIVPPSYPCTYYLSFFAKATKSENSFQISHQLNPILIAPASYLLHTRFSTGILNSNAYKCVEWWESDGVYPVASQKFPLNCTRHEQIESLNSSAAFNKGCWYYGNIQKIIGCHCVVDHFSMIWCRKFLKSESFQLSENDQKEFYYNLIANLIAFD